MQKYKFQFSVCSKSEESSLHCDLTLSRKNPVGTGICHE